MLKKWKQCQYYAIIGIISFIALVFLPLLGSDVGLEWKLPNTSVGWVVYITSKVIVSTINILIFHCFVLQGKINVQNNPRYIEANEILLVTLHEKELEPKSPVEWKKEIYGRKGTTIFITTALASVGLTQAILTFDWLTMLTYLVTIVMGIIFGIFTMNESEDYWTNQYWAYAQKVLKENGQLKYEQETKEKEIELEKQRLEEERLAEIERQKAFEEAENKRKAEEAIRKIEEERLAEIERQRAFEEAERRRKAEEAFRKKQEEEFKAFMEQYDNQVKTLEPEPLPNFNGGIN